MNKQNLKNLQAKANDIYESIKLLKPPMVRAFTENDFNKYIAVGFLINPDPIIMIGRIVQFREESGAFGSNQIFIRCCDGRLQVHENQFFHFVPEAFNHELDVLFKDIDRDLPNRSYSMQHQYEKKGFFIKSNIKEGETTPMREVKESLNKIIGGNR
jgi:hypothetical protein